MAKTVCGWCGWFTHMTKRDDALGVPLDEVSDEVMVMASFTCDNCNFISLAYIVVPRREIHNSNLNTWVDYFAGSLKWVPTKGMRRSFEDVPPHISLAATEAWECFSITAFRGAVQLARSVVEATAKECGCTQGRLVDKIDKMYENSMLRPHIKDAAHEIRHLGNDMAHGDFVDNVTPEEAEECLGLMNEILQEVFQSPARVERRRQARLAKKSDPPQLEGLS